MTTGNIDTDDRLIWACVHREYFRDQPASFDFRKPGLIYIDEYARFITVDDLVSSDDVHFAATGITTGSLLRSVCYAGGGARTYSMVIRGKSGTIRYIKAVHLWDKLMQISDIDYDR